MKTVMVLAALVCSLALVSAQSVYTVNLDGAHENPANASPATGMGTLVLNPDNSLIYNVTYSGLLGTWSANHIHGPGGIGPNGIGTNAPIIFNLNHMSTGTGQGTLSGTTPALNSQQLAWLNSQYLYVNIHSSSFPGGEIRGQIVPEPSTWALMGFGAMGLVWFVRRRVK